MSNSDDVCAAVIGRSEYDCDIAATKVHSVERISCAGLQPAHGTVPMVGS